MLNKKLLFVCLGLFTFSAVNADSIINASQINNIEVSNNADIWEHVRSGFKLEHSENRLVKHYEKKYTQNPSYLAKILNNALPYMYFILLEVERRGIPTELVLLPIVESSYKADAVSPGAISTGLWQFVSSSANRFNMQINSDIDERQDIIKSSQAAISYITYLKDLFGNWELAIAAYNWGEGNIYKAMKKSGSSDYYNLETRDATQNYVPKLIALANIIDNPEKFGLKLNNIPDAPYFALVPSQDIQISDLNDAIDINQSMFKILNPQYKRDYLKSTDTLLIPVEKLDVYAALYTKNTGKEFISEDIPENEFSFPAVNDGKSYASTVKKIKKIKTKATSINIGTSGSHHIVAKGDTLYSIAKKNHTTVGQIIIDNKIKNTAIKLNQDIIITHDKK